MNTLEATVTSIEQLEMLHVLQCRVGEQNIAMLTLQIDTAIKVGSRVCLSVKSTDIMITTTRNVLVSTANRLQARITTIDHGILVSSVRLDMDGIILQSIMTRHALQELALSVGDWVVVLIKESDVSLC